MKHDPDKHLDLQSLWKKMAEEKFGNDKLKKQNIMEAIKQESNTSIDGLRKGLVTKMRFSLAFVIFFIVLILFNLSNTEFLKVMGCITALYAYSTAMLYKLSRKMGGINAGEDKVLSTMKHNLKITKEALRGEQRWSLFVMPMSAPIGILISRTLKGDTILETVQDSRMMMVSLVFALVIVPIVFIVTEKMNNCAFGTKIKSLEENIIRMETLT